MNKATCTCWPEEDAERKKEGERKRERGREGTVLCWMDGNNDGGAVLPSRSCRDVILPQSREILH